jgi:hypothetical protein
VLGHVVALLDCESGSISIVLEAEGYYRKEVDQASAAVRARPFL